MDDDFDSYNDHNEDTELANKFESMLKSKEYCFFDIEEFELLFEYYLDQGDFEKAYTAIEYGLNQYPESGSLKIKLAIYWIEEHQPNRALEILKEVEITEPFNPDVYLNKANIYSQLRQYQKAIDNYFKAVKFVEDKNDQANIYFNIALDYESLNQHDKALNILHNLVKENPKNEHVLYEISYCYNLKQDNESGVTFFKTFLDDNPFSYIGWLNLGLIYSRIELYEKSIEAFDFAIAIKEDFTSAYFNKAHSLIVLKKYDEAIDTFKETLNYKYDNPSALYYIGSCYEKKEDYENAGKYYSEAIALDPFLSDAYAGMAVINEYQEKSHVAAYFIQQALKTDSSNPEYWYIYGDILCELKNYLEAIDAFNKVIELDESNEEIWLDLSEAHLKIDGLEKAIEILDQGLSKNSQNMLVLSRKAAMLLKQGNEQQANQLLTTALEAQPDVKEDFLEYYPEAILFPSIVQTLDNFKL